MNKNLLVFSSLVSALSLSFGFVSKANALGIPAPKNPPVSSPTPAPTPRATPKPVPPSTTQPQPSGSFKALWNGQNADAPNWTLHVQSAVETFGSALYSGPQDVADFCPKYDRLGKQDRLNFWVQLVAAMTKFESSFNPASRYTESTMGIDPVTGRQVVSEGLLQLSYQDENNYRRLLPAGVCDFDFQADSRFAVGDLRRSILDPKKNLSCGVGILNRQVVRTGRLAVGSGAYWAVIKTSNSRNKLSEIRAITNALPFCR